MKDHKPFAFAGLGILWNSPDGSLVKSCTIITTEPNELVSIIHNRMPVILQPARLCQMARYLASDSRSTKTVDQTLPHRGDDPYPVSTLVNKTENDTAQLVVPI